MSARKPIHPHGAITAIEVTTDVPTRVVRVAFDASDNGEAMEWAVGLEIGDGSGLDTAETWLNANEARQVAQALIQAADRVAGCAIPPSNAIETYTEGGEA